MIASPKRIVLTAIVVDLMDIGFNLVAVLITGSVVMLAETLQGVSDLVTDSFIMIGLVRSKRRPNKIHNFGYGKEAFFWAILASLVMISITAVLSIYFGLQRLLNPTILDQLYVAYVVTGISLASNSYSLSLSSRRLFSKLESKWPSQLWQKFIESPESAVKSTFVLDLVGFLSALIGLGTLTLLSLTGNTFFDGLGAIMVGLLLSFLGLTLLTGARSFVIGRSANPKMEAKITNLTKAIPGVRDVLDLKTMHLGSNKMLVIIEIHAQNNLKTDQLERLTDKIKEKISSEIPLATMVQVELETPNPD